MKAISFFGLPLGISTTFWFIVGIFRLIYEEFVNHGEYRLKKNKHLKKSDIAVILPAHNEELVIRSSIKALKRSIRRQHIYVVSDGSKDQTYNLARAERVHVSYLNPGRGKAKAMKYLLEQYRLFERYKLIFIVDADTKIDAQFVDIALSIFNDPEIVAVFGSAQIPWTQHLMPKLGYYFIAYRERLNRMLQYFLIYGQTWKYTNVNYVIPGFATIYRSEILRQLEIDTPGLLIEDFNLAFQLHKRKLGKIGYHPTMVGIDQHPDTLVEYWKQVKRWNIGFFQTVKANRVWPSFFWLSLIIFTLEVFLNSFFILVLPVLLLYLFVPYLPDIAFLKSFEAFYQSYGLFKDVSLLDILVSMLVFDYGMTVVIGLVHKKPQFIFYGIFFIFMHIVTSLILISSLYPGFFGKSSGRWISPTRREE